MARKPRSAPAGDLFSALEPPAAVPEQPVPVLEGLAEVAVEGPVHGSFTYLSGEHRAKLRYGSRVLVPFGRRPAYGYYLGERSAAELQRDGIDPAKLKAIIRVLDAKGDEPLLTPTLLALARWMARHYASPLGQTLASMLPAGVKKGASGATIRLVEARRPKEHLLAAAIERAKRKPKQAALLRLIADATELLQAPKLLQAALASDAALRALEKAGLIAIVERRVAEFENVVASESHDLALNDDQSAALAKIEAALQQPAHAAFLLQGVTGSGKTEVYLRALKTALVQNKQAIVLVPEIALTPQTAKRFQDRLGRERVVVLHSHITDGDRAEAWRAVRAGKIDVVVGARSALFAPLPRLGVVVIDEEHESAFKQESTPRYHARDVAHELARLTNAVLILGSATPSLETMNAARAGGIVPLLLPKRVAGRAMPPVEVVDLTQENRDTNRYTYLSRRLIQLLDQTLARREQAILFLNRRGFATVVTCLRCGNTEKCAFCDITLTSHRATDTLTCHYCNFSKPIPETCGICGAPGVKYWGLGTERIEAEVKKYFTSARVTRMDSDTMTKRTAYLEALDNFQHGRTDVLVGTQMIAKGLDFPNVTLVGVVVADTALHMPDFRSRERTFQLLAQVAGRAGRGEKGGRVVIQTHLPQDPAIKAAAQHDFETFALRELQERRSYAYPPFTRLARILLRSKDLKALKAAGESVAVALRQALQQAPGEIMQVLGPAEPPIARLEGFHRQHILIKASRMDALEQLLNGAGTAALEKMRGAEYVIDVDPISML